MKDGIACTRLEQRYILFEVQESSGGAQNEWEVGEVKFIFTQQLLHDLIIKKIRINHLIKA